MFVCGWFVRGKGVAMVDLRRRTGEWQPHAQKISYQQLVESPTTLPHIIGASYVTSPTDLGQLDP